jgi:DNA-binding MarR family transcriptional regulator
MSRQADQVLQERLGIGMSQFKILMILKWDTNVQQKYIADSLGQTEASISRQIKLLHEQNLLSTTINPKNRRQHITTLTGKGERLTEQAFEVLHTYNLPILGRLSDKQQKQLIEMLSIMHDEICTGNKPGACHHTSGL